MKNLAASIRARLQNHAREQKTDLGAVLEQFALGRLIARLGQSRYAGQFVLKGAQLFMVWASTPHRPTRDVDFLSFGEVDEIALVNIFTEISALSPDEEDTLTWREISAAPIREDNIYGGIRVRLTAMLGNARIPGQVDIRYGDVITPGPSEIEWPDLLDFTGTSLRAYPPETVIAEKLEAAVTLGLANSRMKDFYDLHWLSRNMSFDASTLKQAIQSTFERRNTPLPEAVPIALTDEFVGRSDKQNQWKAFLRKSSLPTLDLADVAKEIQGFLAAHGINWAK